MSTFEIDRRDARAADQMVQFGTGFAEYGESLGFTADQILAVTAAATTFRQALVESAQAQDRAKNATAQKDQARREGEEIIRNFAQRVKLDPNAGSEALAAMGISIGPNRSNPVRPPTNLTANPSALGKCKVQWNRNRNAPRTQFIIEVREGGTGPWVFAATTTKTKWMDPNAPPGVMKQYRVRAQRGDEKSVFVDGAVIYLPPKIGPMQQAA